MRKNLFKTVATIAATFLVILPTANCLAATVTTTTTYNISASDKVAVKTDITGVDNGTMVTYLLSSVENVTTGDDILYIGQETVPSTGKVTFDYKVSKTDLVNVSPVLKFGSNNGTEFTGEKGTGVVKYGNITITGDVTAQLASAGTTVDSNFNLGKGETATLTLTPADGKELVSVTKDGVEVFVNAANHLYNLTGDGNAIVISVKTAAVTSDTASVTKVADLDEGLAGFVAKVSTKTNAEYGAALYKTSDGIGTAQYLEAATTGSDVDTATASKFYAIKIVKDTTEGAIKEEDAGNYTLVPYVKIGDAISYDTANAVTFVLN